MNSVIAFLRKLLVISLFSVFTAVSLYLLGIAVLMVFAAVAWPLFWFSAGALTVVVRYELTALLHTAKLYSSVFLYSFSNVFRKSHA